MIHRRWRRDGNCTTEWLPDPSRRAGPRFQHQESEISMSSILLSSSAMAVDLGERSLVIPSRYAAFDRTVLPVELVLSLTIADAYGASGFGLGFVLGLCVLRADMARTILGISSCGATGFWFATAMYCSQFWSPCSGNPPVVCLFDDQVPPFAPSSIGFCLRDSAWLRDTCAREV